MDDLGVPLFSETAILCKISHTSNFIQDDLLLSPPFHLFFVHLFLLTSALAAVSNLHFFDDHHHFITHSSCHYSPLTHFIIRSRTYAWRVWYGGGVGGWGGGIMTFVTTTGHIVSVDDHHHFITHSSCHYSPLTHSIIRSRTYAWRVWYVGGGGWVGGGDNDVRYNYWTHCVRRWSSPFHHAFIVPLLTSHALHHSFPAHTHGGYGMGGGVGGWVGGIHILLAVAPQLRHGSLAKRSWPVPCLKKDLPAAVPGWSIELWFLIPEHIFSLMMNYDWDYQKHHRRYSGRDLVFRCILADPPRNDEVWHRWTTRRVRSGTK